MVSASDNPEEIRSLSAFSGRFPRYKRQLQPECPSLDEPAIGS
jgi:hypothetical protein